jgi:thiol-disulfide isomerase/thioredoxin
MLCKLRDSLKQNAYGQPLWILLLVSLLLITLVYLIYTYSIPDDTTNTNASNTNAPNTNAPSFNAPSSNAKSSNTKSSNKIKVYNFNTSWCGWSKKFQPEWDKFQQTINNDNNLSSRIDAQDVKCDNNEDMCKQYNIPGFPTILIINDGKQINYTGDRTSNALLSFISNL